MPIRFIHMWQVDDCPVDSVGDDLAVPRRTTLEREMDHRLKTFAQEACRRFDFLVAEHDFTGPLCEPRTTSDRRPVSLEVRYVSPSLTVAIQLTLGFGGEEEVGTGLVLRTADEVIAADVGHVAAAAGLGPAQHISCSARTATQMRGSLTAQAAALRQLVPLLRGGAGAALMRDTQFAHRRPSLFRNAHHPGS
jgi:hypothetical protein